MLAFASELLKESFFAKLLRQIFDNPIIYEGQRYISLWLSEVAAVIGEIIDVPGLIDLQNLLAGELSELPRKISADAANDFSTSMRHCQRVYRPFDWEMRSFRRFKHFFFRTPSGSSLTAPRMLYYFSLT